MVACLLALGLATACGQDGDGGTRTVGTHGQDSGSTTSPSGVTVDDLPEVAAHADAGPTRLRFEDLSERAGISAINHSGRDSIKEYLVEAVGVGPAWLDYNDDGWIDLYLPDADVFSNYTLVNGKNPLTNGTRMVLEPKSPRPERFADTLWRNNGDGSFTDVSEAAGLAGEQSWSFGATAFDLEGDGDTDVFVSNFGPNALWRNNGDGTFTDIAAAIGAAGSPLAWSTCAAVGDIDGDGRIDLYVTQYSDPAAEVDRRRRATVLPVDTPVESVSGRACRWRGILAYCGPLGLLGQQDTCLRQRADGSFEDMTAAWGLVAPVGQYGFTTAMYDYDDDGLLDIYVANDSVENFMWHQSRDDNGKISFRDDSDTLGVKYGTSESAQASMGMAVADVDRDGLLDVLVTNFSFDYNNIFKGKRVGSAGTHFFKDRGLAVMGASTYLDLSWGCGWFDFDNDADLDLFIANGHVYREIDNFPRVGTSYAQWNSLFECLDPVGMAYREVGRKAQEKPPAGVDPTNLDAGPGMAVRLPSRAATFGDWDNDGRIDVVVGNMNVPVTVLRNTSKLERGGGNWIKFRCRQPGGNRDALGASIEVTAAGATQRFPVLRCSSFLGTNDDRIHVGLGRDTVCDVRVIWPGQERAETTFTGLSAGKLWVLERDAEATEGALPVAR